MPYQFNPITGQLDLVSASAILDGEVETWADLPQTVGEPLVGSTFFVKASTGVWLVNRRQAGIWVRTGDTGVRANDWTYGGDYPVNSVNGQTGNVSLTASSVSALPAPTISSPSISGDTVLTASRNQLRYLTATGGTVANITLPYSGNENGDICTLVAVFVGASSVGQFTIRAAGQMAGGLPVGYSTLATLLSSGQSVSLISDGSNGFGGWSIVAVGGNFPTTSNAVQEYDVTGVLLPNGDSGSAVQLTRNTTTPQTPDGSDRTFNAEQLIYRRVSGTAQRLDTYLGVKLEWQPVAPTTKTSTGSTGQIAYADPYFYICVGVNTWRRVPVAAW